MKTLVALFFWLLLATASLAQGVTTSFGSSGGGGGITSLTNDCAASGTGAVPIYCNTIGGYKAANWYVPYGLTVASASGSANATGTIYCSSGTISKKVTLSQLGAVIATVSAGGNFQQAIYTSVNGYASALVAATASGSTATAGFVGAALSANIQVGPGTTAGKELQFCSQVDNATAVFVDTGTIGNGFASLTGSATGGNVLSSSAQVSGVRCTAGCQGGTPTFGTWPASLATSTWIDVTARNIIAPAFLVNSVP